MHDIVFTSARERGWDIVPMFHASREGQVFRGTASEILEQIAEFEHQQAEREDAKRRIREQEERERLDKLVARAYALLGERFEAWDRYRARDDHQSKMDALRRSGRALDQLTETVRELMQYPRDVLLAHDKFVAFRDAYLGNDE